MIWAAESGFSAGPSKESITGEKYREILANQVHPTMQTLFLVGDGTFQDDNAPINAAGLVQSFFEELENEI
ncbi:DDE_3 domain-containing protein [Trichonephila clavipes]|nr:DDE_3 domain-containing protein [Trichonephila clavipes]